MEDQTKNVLIGVLLLAAVISLFFAVEGSLTGQSVKQLNTGILSVRPSIGEDVDVYVDGDYAFTVLRTKRPYYTLEAGVHQVVVKAAGYEDYTETITITAGEETVVYAQVKL